MLKKITIKNLFNKFNCEDVHFLKTIKAKAQQYLVYVDKYLPDKEHMMKNSIIGDFADFLDCVHKYQRTEKSFEAYWNSRSVSVNPLEESSIPPYKNNIPGCVYN